MASSEQTPIACTLRAQDYKQRLAWIEKLTREALREHNREDLVLRLTYAPEAGGRVREMVTMERACCAFLAFDLDEGGDDAVHLIITVPEAARGSADVLLDPFLPARGSTPPAVAANQLVNHHRRAATPHQIASTTPNGHAPCRKP